MSDSTIVFAIVGATMALFIWNRLPVIVVAMASALALAASGVITLPQALAGFGDPVIMFIASLFVVAAALEATGVTAWAARLFSRAVGDSRARLLVFMMLLVAVLSPLISMSGAVAALLPVVMVMATRLGESPSRLMLPLAFASGAGSKLALTGTPKNVLISDAAVDAGYAGFGFFEFAIVGVPLLIGTILIVVLLGRYLIPERAGARLPPDLSRHAETLIEQFRLTTDTFQLRVHAGSPLVGVRREALDPARHPGLDLLTVSDAAGRPRLSGAIAADDTLVMRGEAGAAAQFATGADLAFREGDPADGGLFGRESGLAEVVIPPRSALIGRTVFPGMVTAGGDLVVLAVQRQGEDVGPGETALAAGDHLLLQGTWKALDERLADPRVLVVDSPDLVRRQAVPFGFRGKALMAVVLAMVLALAIDLVPPAVAGILAASAAILLRAITVEQSYRAINWTTVIMIAAMFPISTAMYQTGAASLVGKTLVAMIGEAEPYVLLTGLFVLASTLGMVISNTATAMIVIPIAVVAADEFGVSAMPVLMALNVGASAAFLTPVSTAVNLMVMGPAGYRFGDYWKLGLPLTLWYFVVAVILVPLVWGF